MRVAFAHARAERKGLEYRLFVIACCLWTGYSVLHNPFYQLFLMPEELLGRDFVTNTVMLLVVASEVMRMNRPREGMRSVVGGLALAVMCAGPAHLGMTSTVTSAVLIWSSRDFDTKRVVASCAATLSACALVAMASATAGLIPDTVLYQTDPDRVRHCLGFTYALVPSQIMFCLTCAVCYVRGTKIRLAECAMLLLADYLCYLLTGSRQNFLLSCALVLCLYACRYAKPPRKIGGAMRTTITWVFLVVAIVSILLTVAYGVYTGPGRGLLDVADNKLGGRLRLGFSGMQEYVPRLFGQVVQSNGGGLNIYGQRSASTVRSYFYIDNLFVRLLLQEGIVYLIGLVALLTLAMRKAARDGDAGLQLALAVTAVHCVIDDMSGSLTSDLLLFAIGGLCAPVHASTCTSNINAYREQFEGGQLVSIGSPLWETVSVRARTDGVSVAIWNMSLACMTAVFGLCIIGIGGSSIVDYGHMVGRTAIYDKRGSAVLSLVVRDDQEALVTYRHTFAKGTLHLERSNQSTETYELFDFAYTDGAESEGGGITISVPHSYDHADLTGRTLVSYYDPVAGEYTSDYIEILDGGKAFIYTGKFNALDMSDGAMREAATECSWQPVSDGVQIFGSDEI